MYARYFVPVLLLSLQCVTAQDFLGDLSTVLPTNSITPPEFCEMAHQDGYPCVQHEVITEDGYILRLYHIEGDPQKPVFLQHGFIDSSDTWILRGHDSPAAFLHNNSYDLWLGNTRGNMYSRAHTTLDPDGLEFWNFTFHEMALYDLPTMIDFILDKTGQTKLQVLAHSQGTQAFIAMAVLKPEYVSKIKIVVCFAPIAYLTNAQQPLFLLLSLAGGQTLSSAIGVLGHGEFLRNSSVLATVFRTACTQQLIGYPICGLGFASVVFGPDPKQFEPEFERKAFKHYPCGSSTKNTIHLGQIVSSRRFQWYDYGLRNLIKYGRLRPPVYDLSKVALNVSLYVGKNDRLSTIPDVDRLRAELNPDVIREYIVMKDDMWNHIDFVWGKDMGSKLFPKLLNTLKNNY